jgi:hypothetical protein
MEGVGRRWSLALVLLAALAAVPGAAAGGGLPGARAHRICGAAGPFWPTMTLALHGSSAWVACKEQRRVIRVALGDGRTTASVRLGAPAIAVATAYGSVWALDSGGTLHRVRPGTAKVARRIRLPVAAAFNIWVGGGSVWVADDQGERVVRVSPRTNRVVARLRVGNGPSSMAFAGSSAWVVNHRDRVLTHIALRTNRPRRVAVLPGDAPERMAWAAGRLWVTGRGTDLLKVNPADGSVEDTIEIGASGIDIVARGGRLWVPTRSASVDARGFPTMEALKRVSTATGGVSVVAEASGRVDVHGLVARGGVLWLADNTGGRLYRIG